MTQLSEIQQVALSKALAMLKGAGAKYIVVLPDGAEHVLGDLKLAPRARKRVQVVAPGTYKKIYEPLLNTLEVGDVAQVPVDQFDGKALQSACISWSNRQWGVGSCISHRTKKHIEIMRIA